MSMEVYCNRDFSVGAYSCQGSLARSSGYGLDTGPGQEVKGCTCKEI